MGERTFTIRYDDGGLADAASPREARARRYWQALLAFCGRHVTALIALLIAGVLADIALKKAFGIHIFFISLVSSGTVFALLGYVFYRDGRNLYDRVFLSRRENPPGPPLAPTGADAYEWGRAIDGVGLWIDPEYLGLVADPGQYETYPWSDVRLDEAKFRGIGRSDLIVHLPHRHLRYSGDKLGVTAADIIARASSLAR